MKNLDNKYLKKITIVINEIRFFYFFFKRLNKHILPENPLNKHNVLYCYVGSKITVDMMKQVIDLISK